MAGGLKFGPNPNLPSKRRLFGFKNLSSPNDAPLQRISQYSVNFIYNDAPWILSGHAVRLLAGTSIRSTWWPSTPLPTPSTLFTSYATLALTNV